MFVGHESPGAVVFGLSPDSHFTRALLLSCVYFHYNGVEKNVKYTETFQDLATLLLDVVEIGRDEPILSLEHMKHRSPS